MARGRCHGWRRQSPKLGAEWRSVTRVSGSSSVSIPAPPLLVCDTHWYIITITRGLSAVILGTTAYFFCTWFDTSDKFITKTRPMIVIIGCDASPMSLCW